MPALTSLAELRLYGECALQVIAAYSELTLEKAAECIGLQSGGAIKARCSVGENPNHIHQACLYAAIGIHQKMGTWKTRRPDVQGTYIYTVRIVAAPFKWIDVPESCMCLPNQSQVVGALAYSPESCSCPEWCRWTHEYLKDAYRLGRDLNFQWVS